MELKHLLKDANITFGGASFVGDVFWTERIEELDPITDIHDKIVSAVLASGHTYELGTFTNAEIHAALHQDDDAHENCTLTACLDPLHPGPCKGWKHSLFQAAPSAWHALEAARVEKANKARVAKIEHLKSQGLPIPKKLLTPIVAKPHPHAGKTADMATGEAHAAGHAVSEAAGVHVNEPGKVTLGQAVKTIGTDATNEKGAKGLKPSVASKGIAHVIAQEKVTPQYKLDKAAKITPEQWAALSSDEKSVIRGELVKIKKDGFGPQQKKADELLDKLPASPALKPETVTIPKGAVVQKINLPPEPASSFNEKVESVKAEMAKGTSLSDAIKKVTGKDAEPEHPLLGQQVTAKSIMPGAKPLTGELVHHAVHVDKVGPLAGMPITKAQIKDAQGNLHPVRPESIKAAPKPGPIPSLLKTKLSETAAPKSGPHPLLGQQVEAKSVLPGAKKLTGKLVHHEVKVDKTGALAGTVHEKAEIQDAEGKLHLVKPASIKPLAETPKGLQPSAPLAPGTAAHIQHAVAMANGTAHGSGWSKNHLAAYEKLTPDEFKNLDPAVQGKIVQELEKAQTKFLDPKKIQASKDLLAKFGAATGLPAVEHKPSEPENLSPAYKEAVQKAEADLKTAAGPKLSDYDQGVIHDAYMSAWSKNAAKAVTYGVKTYGRTAQMKAHPQYAAFAQDLDGLKALAGKVALAHAEVHQAKLAVPTDLDTGAMEKGSPEYKHLLAALDKRSAIQAQFNDLHKQAQTKLDTIRTDSGLTKRALPKLDSAAVKTAAAETGYYKTGGYSGPNYGKAASAKGYMLAKVGPGLAVTHKTSTDKAQEKLATAASKIENKPAKGVKAEAEAMPSAKLAEPVKLGRGGDSIAHIPADVKTQLTADFKGMPKGKFLTDPTEDVFDNLVNLAAAHGKNIPGGMSVDQALKTIDETHAKNLGVDNTGMLHAKITDWLGTAAGKAYAEQHSTPDKKKVQDLTGEFDLPAGVTLAPGEKVQKLAGPGPHDESIPAHAFHARTADESQKIQDDYMKANGLTWTADQKKAIRAYTGNGHGSYSTFNNYLRGKGAATGSQRKQIVEIQAAMMPLTEHTLLKRGTGWSGLPFDKETIFGMVGETFEDKAFTSSAVAGSGGHFSGQPLQLVIEAPKGTPAAFVNNHSQYKGSENEMLLAAGTKFKILSVEKTSGGHVLARVRVVGGK